MNKVPSNKVGEVVQDYVDDNKTTVTCTKQADGTWTVVAS
jgi:hypothetical protein